MGELIPTTGERLMRVGPRLGDTLSARGQIGQMPPKLTGTQRRKKEDHKKPTRQYDAPLLGARYSQPAPGPRGQIKHTHDDKEIRMSTQGCGIPRGLLLVGRGGRKDDERGSSLFHLDHGSMR